MLIIAGTGELLNSNPDSALVFISVFPAHVGEGQFFIQASLFSQFCKPILNSFFSGASVSLCYLSLNGEALFYCGSFAG
jgi:hypothetical protein